MKKKYKIIDLSNNPQDLQPGDMVKLRKGLKINKHYGSLTLLQYMRFRYYRAIKDFSPEYNIMIVDKRNITWYYSIEMLDLTCVKRRITDDNK